MLIRAALSSGDKGVLLENIGAATTVTCSTGQIIVDFADEASADIARSWPAGTILLTLTDGCNTEDERGVYVISRMLQPIRHRRATGNFVTFTVAKRTLQDVVDELDISYGHLVDSPDGNQLTSYTTTVTSYFTHSTVGTLTSSVFVSTITPTLTTGTYTSMATSTPLSTGYSGSSTVESVASSASSSFSLSPSAEAIMNDIAANLPAPGPDGTITIDIKKGNDVPVVVQPIGSEPFNDDPAYQAQLQAAMEADHLDSTETLVTDAVDGLADEGESNVPADSPVQLGNSEYAGTDDAVYDSAPPVEVTTTSGNAKRQTPATSISAPAPRAAVKSTDITRLSSRNSLSKREDGWDTFFAVMGDDAIGEICEICGAMYVHIQLFHHTD